MKYTISGEFINLKKDIIEHWSTENTLFTANGNVGIMTNNPQTRLDVNGSISASDDITLKKRNGNIIIDGLDYDPVLRLKTTNDSGWTLRNDVPNDNLFSIGKDNKKNIFNIKEDGNIGINKVKPNYKLDIFGSEPKALLNIDNPSINGSGIKINTKDKPLQIIGGDDGNIKHFTVNGKGNVGIGIENPDSSLEVNKFKKGDLVRLNNTNPDGNGLILGADQYPLKIGKSNSLEGEFLSVKGNGNVGIGERDPDNKLVVRGTIQADKFVNKDGVLIGGEENTTLEATTICLNNGKTGTDFEKLCLGIDDFKFIRDFKKVMQYSANDKKSWIF